MEEVEASLQDDLEYYQENGISFIELMKSNKDFQNPKILQQTIDYFKIDGNGTQFDPVGHPSNGSFDCAHSFVGGV